MPLTRDNVVYDSKYGDIPGLNDVFNQRILQLAGVHSDSAGARQTVAKEFDNAIDTFKNLFKNNVGREASSDEISKAVQESIGQSMLSGNTQGQGLRNGLAQYIGDTFQQTAQDVAQQKTKDLEGQYSSLADQYMAMGKKSLGNLSDELKTYSTSLFEKLRPQLNLAAQAGGYGDSGGQTLQEQGALTDLANQGRGVLADKAYDLETNANSIRFGGAAAPVSMASEFAAGIPYAVSNLGSKANSLYNQDWLGNQQYARQLGLLSAQNRINQENTPSFGDQLWKELALGSAKGFTGGLGNQLNQFAYDKYKGGGGGSGGGGSASAGGGEDWMYA